MKVYDTAILGGGWAGLLYAQRELIAYKNKIAIIEKSSKDQIGGLLKSEVIDGCTFDIGGPHLLFSRDSNVLSNILNLLDKNVTKRERNNYILYKDKLIPYPFENGIYELEPEIRVKFVKGIIERMINLSKNPEWRPKNFMEWILGFFGDYMAKEYLIPYNLKIWKRPLENISADWVFIPGRLPYPDLEELIRAAAGMPSIGYKEQAHFYYPIKGGIQSLYNSLYEKVSHEGVEFLYDENVNNVEKFSDGIYEINEKIKAKKVVNTIPLPELLLSLNDSQEMKALADEFDYNSVIIIGVIVSQKTPNHTTVYVPNQKIVFHRYTWMSSLIPCKEYEKSNLIVEVTLPKGETFDKNRLVSEVIKNLADIGAIKDEKNVMLAKLWYHKYGYPIYTLNHKEVRSKAFEILNNLGIKTVGRWGSWHYWNTDMVYKAVYEMSL